MQRGPTSCKPTESGTAYQCRNTQCYIPKAQHTKAQPQMLTQGDIVVDVCVAANLELKNLLAAVIRDVGHLYGKATNSGYDLPCTNPRYVGITNIMPERST